MTSQSSLSHKAFMALLFVGLGLACVATMLVMMTGIGSNRCPDIPRDEELYQRRAKPPLGGVVALSLAEDASCATMRDGTTTCWGRVAPVFTEGQVSHKGRPRARRVNVPCGGATCEGSTLSLGEDGYCVRSREGKLVCAPRGAGAAFPRAELDHVSSVAMGAHGACALREGSLWCFASVGETPSPFTPIPTRIEGAPSDLDRLTFGGDRICVLTRAGVVACAATEGIAPGALVFRTLELGSVAVSVSAGSRHACAVTREGRVRCWGTNEHGELGLGPRDAGVAADVSESPDPRDVQGLPELATQVVAEGSRTCAMSNAGHVYCWGNLAECGPRCQDRSPHPQRVPVQVPGLEDVVEVSLGRDHGCARKRDGDVACWGDNRHHQVSAFIPFDDQGMNHDYCDVSRRLDLPGSDYPVDVRW